MSQLFLTKPKNLSQLANPKDDCRNDWSFSDKIIQI